MEYVCKSKEAGGLGIRDIINWNKASLGKYAYWLYLKADKLWIKWINSVYLKDCNWEQYEPHGDVSWVWKKICMVRNQMKEGFEKENWMNPGTGYTIAAGYNWLRGEELKICWGRFLWNRLMIPRASFISWLAILQKLQLRDKLKRYGVCMEDQCLLCQDDTESHGHVFFKCTYAKRCLENLKNWTNINFPEEDTLIWCSQKRMASKLMKQVAGSIICNLIYHIWWARNKCRIDLVLIHPDKLCEIVKKEIKSRIKCNVSKLSNKDTTWLQRLV